MCRVGRQEPLEPVPRSTPLLLGDLVDAVDQDECLASGEYVIGPALRLRGGQGAPNGGKEILRLGRGPTPPGRPQGQDEGNPPPPVAQFLRQFIACRGDSQPLQQRRLCAAGEPSQKYPSAVGQRVL